MLDDWLKDYYKNMTDLQRKLTTLPTRINKMHRAYGSMKDGEICKNCEYLLADHYHKKYFKCEKYNVSRSEASDWRISWPACGKFKLEVKDE